MITSNNVLENILNKSPVVETYSSELILEIPDAVYDNYGLYLNTYIPIGDYEFDDRFSKSILQSKTVMGYISAPYGYGKTSKCISMWDHCRKKNILSVPPFKFDGKLDSIRIAVHACVRHVFKNKYQEYLPKIDEIYDKYQSHSKEYYIEEISKNHVNRNDATNIVKNLVNDGSLNIKVNAKTLMNYLKDIRSIVSEKFEGIAIFVDEVQGISDTSLINDLRTLIFELETNKHLNLGIMFVIPDAQEEDLMKRAGDVMQRLKKYYCHLNLASSFEQHFAKKLWLEYSKKYCFDPYDLVEEDCLEALGEISAREDLGMGPRTIIDVFKRICVTYKTNNCAYTVLDMMSDFLDNDIAYISEKYLKVLRDSLALSEIDTRDKKNVIKLLCAFPLGIDENKISTYGLSDAFDDVVAKFYTTVIKYNIKGYTLAGLENESTTDFITQNVMKFRTSYSSNDQLYQNDLVKCFTDHIIPEIFEKRKGTQLTCWTTNKIFPIYGGYGLELVGTFDKKYPERFIKSSVILEGGNHTEYFPDLTSDAPADVEFIFNLIVDEKRNSKEDSIQFEGNDKVIFNLNMLKKVTVNELPGALKKLQNCIKPKDVTPMFLLCLLYYFKTFEKEVYIQNQGEIKHMTETLTRYAKRFMFSDELKEKYGYKMNYEKFIGEIFKKMCSEKYPKYETIINTHIYYKDLKHYLNYLKEFSIPQRKGLLKIDTTKNELAKKLSENKNLNVAGIKEECSVGKWKNFIELIKWDRSDETSFKFKLHPLESHMLRIFEDNASPHLKDNLFQNACEMGYTYDEFNEIIKIMIARGYFEEAGDYLIKVSSVATTDVLSHYNELLDLARNTFTIYNAYGEKPNIPIPADLGEKIKLEKDPEKLQIHDEKIKDMKRNIESYLQSIQNRIMGDKKTLVEDLSKLNEDIQRSLTRCAETNDLKTSSDSLLDSIRHLNKQLKEIRNKYGDLILSLTRSLDEIRSANGNPETLAKIIKSKNAELRDLRQSYSEIERHLQKWYSWRTLIEKLETISEKIECYINADLNIEEEQREFKRIIDEICSGFAETQNKYLVGNLEVMTSDINKLSTDVVSKEGELKSSFNKIIENINRNLRRFNEIEFITNELRTAKVDGVFSIEEKDKSYELVEDRVKRLLKNVSLEFKNYLEQLKREIALKLPENEKQEFLETLNNENNSLNLINGRIDNLEIFDENLIKDIEDITSEFVDKSTQLMDFELEIKKAQRNLVENERLNPIMAMITSQGAVTLNEIISDMGMELDEVISCIKDIYRGSLAEIILRKR